MLFEVGIVASCFILFFFVCSVGVTRRGTPASVAWSHLPPAALYIRRTKQDKARAAGSTKRT